MFWYIILHQASRKQRHMNLASSRKHHNSHVLMLTGQLWCGWVYQTVLARVNTTKKTVHFILQHSWHSSHYFSSHHPRKGSLKESNNDKRSTQSFNSNSYWRVIYCLLKFEDLYIILIIWWYIYIKQEFYNPSNFVLILSSPTV